MASNDNPATPAEQPLGTGEIAVDTSSDTDSAYAESTHESDTQSLSSSVLKYTWEHGRRYHAYKDGEYWGPNDEKQLDAEDFVHQMFLNILDGKLHLAPIPKDVQKVLDVGCGTGIWCIDFADEYPSADVLGLDLSPVQPNFVPPNCRFEVDDLTQDWTYGEKSFDYIHMRQITGCVPDWVAYYRKLLIHVKPGGWIEQVELSTITKSDDGTVTKDMPFQTWYQIFKDLGDKTGKTFAAAEIAKDCMNQAGFVNVTEHIIKLPVGPWPKDKSLKQWGIWSRVYLTDALEGFALRGLTGFLGWSYEESQVFLASMRKAIRDPAIHGYIDMKVIYGQRAREMEVE